MIHGPRRSGCRSSIGATPADHFQSDFTTSSFSGSTGSLLRRWMWNSCGPSIPGCMVNSRDTAVSPPEAIAVEPTAARGGQHPFTSSTSGWPRICSVALPTFLILNTADTSRLTGCMPRSILSRSTTRRAFSDWGVKSAGGVLEVRPKLHHIAAPSSNRPNPAGNSIGQRSRVVALL
jgi:hypothetical protein